MGLNSPRVADVDTCSCLGIGKFVYFKPQVATGAIVFWFHPFFPEGLKSEAVGIPTLWVITVIPKLIDF